MNGFDPARFQALRRGAFGADLRNFERLGSTQDEARQACSAGAGEGAVVVAEEQGQGRGRWGRRWVGQAGQSLLCTVLLKAEAGAAEPGSLPLVLGLASAEALQELGLQDVSVKWPNDIWWRGCKLGGLLVEGCEGFWLAGLGLNCGQSEDEMPAEIRAFSSSLKLAGLDLEREAVLAGLLAAWESWLRRWRRDGNGAWLEAYAALDALRGRPCRVRSAGSEWIGLADGVELDGSLRLMSADGAVRRMQSAEIELIRPLQGSHDGREH